MDLKYNIPKFMDAVKAVFSGKFIAIHVPIKKKERSQINNPSTLREALPP